MPRQAFTARSVPGLAIFALLWLSGLYLRVPILVAPPLAPAIATDLYLSQTATGALTTLPLLTLALGSLPAALLIVRLGARNTLVLALVLVALGSAGRALAPPAVVLFSSTAVMGFGVAAMQPALPALVPRWCPGYVALACAVYMNGQLLGEFVSAGLTLPVLMPLTGDDWRVTLLVWSLPGLLIAAALLGPRSAARGASVGRRWQPDWHTPRVWQLGVLLGGSAVVFFGTNAYMGSVLSARGAGDQLAAYLFVFNFMQVLASIAMLIWGQRLVTRRAPIVVASIANTLGMLAFMALSGIAGLVAVLTIGFFSAVQLILLVSLPPQVSEPEDAGRLAAGMFAIGYSIAFLVPLLGGSLADLTGQPVLALLPILAFVAASTLIAIYVDVQHDEGVATASDPASYPGS